jgi:hypothetical protein
VREVSSRAVLRVFIVVPVLHLRYSEIQTPTV